MNLFDFLLFTFDFVLCFQFGMKGPWLGLQDAHKTFGKVAGLEQLARAARWR